MHCSLLPESQKQGEKVRVHAVWCFSLQGKLRLCLFFFFFFFLIKKFFGVSIVAQQKQTRLVSMKTRVQSLASFIWLRIRVAVAAV